MYPGEGLTKQFAHMLPKDGNTYIVRRSHADARNLFLELRTKHGYVLSDGIWHLLTATTPTVQRVRQRHINRAVRILQRKAGL